MNFWILDEKVVPQHLEAPSKPRTCRREAWTALPQSLTSWGPCRGRLSPGQLRRGYRFSSVARIEPSYNYETRVDMALQYATDAQNTVPECGRVGNLFSLSLSILGEKCP